MEQLLRAFVANRTTSRRKLFPLHRGRNSSSIKVQQRKVALLGYSLIGQVVNCHPPATRFAPTTKKDLRLTDDSPRPLPASPYHDLHDPGPQTIEPPGLSVLQGSVCEYRRLRVGSHRAGGSAARNRSRARTLSPVSSPLSAGATPSPWRSGAADPNAKHTTLAEIRNRLYSTVDPGYYSETEDLGAN